MAEIESVYTVEELAERWKVKPSTIYGMIRSGKVAAFKVGVGYRISASAIRRVEEGEA